MDIIGGIILIGCGALCVPSHIIKKTPDAKNILDKIVPYQGVIGIVICVLGIIGTIFWFFNIGFLFEHGLPGFVLWLTNLATSVLSGLIGFLLGFGLIKSTFLTKASDAVKGNAEELYKKLTDVQIPLGFTAFICGAWTILYAIIYSLIAK